MMKVKDIEGTPKEIGKFCIEHNFSIHEYLEVKPKIKSKVIILVSLLFSVLCIFLYTNNFSVLISTTIFFIEILLICLISILIQLKFQNWISTCIGAVFGLIMFGISIKIFTPKDVIFIIKDIFSY